MASLVPTVKDKEFQNWLRGALALLFTKQGLDDFVKDEITQFQTHLLINIFRNNNIPFGTVCNTCTTENVLPCPTQNFCPNGRRCNLHDPAQPDKKPNHVCPNNICHDIREAIRREHRYNRPSWKNTNASKWCTNGFEIAKCFMPPDGYSAVTTFLDTDFNGILAVIINNKRFQNKMAAQLHQQNNVCIEAREVGRVIRHSADLSITDTDLAKHIDTLINLLSDPKYLVAHQKAKEAVDKLKQLKSNQLSITTSDIILVIDNALKDIVTKQRDNALQAILVEKDEANRVIEEKTNASVKLLGDVKDSLAHTQTLAVSSLNQVAAAKLSALGDIMNVSKKEQQEIAATGTKERQLVSEEIKSVSANEQKELAAAGTRERQLVSEEIRRVSAKEQQELAATGTRERQLVSEEIKSISAKEQQELAATGTRERQLVSEEIKSISAKEQQELAAAGTREIYLIGEEIKSISAKEQQKIAREKQLVSEEIKSISVMEQQEIAATGTSERQLISEEIRNLSDKERKELAATGTKEKQLAIEEIKQLLVKEKKELLAVVTQERELIREECRKGNDLHNQQAEVLDTSRTQEELEKCLRQDLITFYRTYHSTISIAPLVEEHDVPLVDFYVQPPLIATDATFRQTEDSPTTIPVHSYRNLFYRDNGDLYKNIYITAKAGIGKTSFSKRICMTWCQAHNPLQSLEQKFEPDNLEVLKKFEFLFFVPLRDTDTSECEVDNMIYNQVINNLATSHRYTEYFIKDVLQERQCLILIDGLDEWTHPESCKRRSRNVHETPHCPARERCSIIMTTRPWKLDVAQISLSKIDQHVEINELNKTSSNMFISNAVSLLNKRRNQTKHTGDFHRIASSRNLNAIRYIPYILLQMICLWFDGKSIGKSKCETYSNITELTLVRGLMKTNWSYSPRQCTSVPASIRACLSSNESCKLHYDIILSLGKVAFETLFTLTKESRLVFPKTVVLNTISEEMLTFLLKTGLISQNKDYGRVAYRQSNFSFQHKSLQEYFAALYICSNSNDKGVHRRICQVCNSLGTVLEISNVFVFLSGFSSEICGKILQMVQQIVSSDSIIKYYRNTLCMDIDISSEFERSFREVKSLRDMHIEIMQEIINNDRKDFSSHIEDIVIQYLRDKNSFSLLKPLIQNSKAYIKSLCIAFCSSTDEFSEVLDIFGLRNVKLLHKLRICAVPVQSDLCCLLSGSVQTLTCLEIRFTVYNGNLHYSEYTTIESKTVRLISNMDHLLSLSLIAAVLTHSDMKVLFKHLSKRRKMTGISLANIRCTVHNAGCSGHSVDLSRHHELKTLELHCVENISVLKLPPTSLLETSFIGRLPKSVYSSLFEYLFHATCIRVFVVGYSLDAFNLAIETLPNLTNLRALRIKNTDLGDRKFSLSTEMKNIDFVSFYKVTMTSTALRTFIGSTDVLPQSIRIRLKACTISSEQEYQHLKSFLRSSHKYRIMFDGLNSSKQNLLHFQTIGDGTR